MKKLIKHCYAQATKRLIDVTLPNIVDKFLHLVEEQFSTEQTNLSLSRFKFQKLSMLIQKLETIGY